MRFLFIIKSNRFKLKLHLIEVTDKKISQKNLFVTGLIKKHVNGEKQENSQVQKGRHLENKVERFILKDEIRYLNVKSA